MAAKEDTVEIEQGFLYHMLYDTIDEAVVARLKECGDYQNWQKELGEILKKNSGFEDLLMKVDGAVSLTETEHKLFVRYNKLLDKMHSAEKQQCYYVGQIHAGMMLGDLAECMGGTWRSCGRRIQEELSGNGILLNREEEQKMLGDLINTVRNKRVENLQKNADYRKLQKREQELLEKQPFIQRLIGGDDMGRELKLSHAQQQALTDFFALQKQKSTYEMLETLLIGYKACMVQGENTVTSVQCRNSETNGSS